MNALRDNLVSDLAKFGAIESSIRWLDEASWKNIDYLDLIPSRAVRPIEKDALWPSAAIETSGAALAYVLRADILSRNPLDDGQLNRLRHNLTCRGDAEYLIVWKPGALSLYRLGLSKDLPDPLEVTHASDGAPSLFQDLANETLVSASRKHDEIAQKVVHQVLFDVMSQVTSALVKSEALHNNRSDVISLVGRALFTRFLIDRGIINKTTFPDIYTEDRPECCFDTHQMAAKTCRWLDDTFNGELLPLADRNYTKYFNSLASMDEKVFGHLSNILHRSPNGQLSLDIYWDTVNFAHVPIGVLSQVYEHYAHKLFSKGAQAESIYYTPRFIAEILVEQAMAGVTTSPVDQARVLDPAAGAGIFLVLCLRKLVASRWEKTGVRPDKTEIRNILNNQIFGFDINESALCLSALSLYLTVLELDPDPFPPESLKFRALLKNNLFMTRGNGEEYPRSLVLGSLGDGIPENHEGLYDIIISNPPWTAWKGKGSEKLNERASQMIRSIASKRNVGGHLSAISTDYENPDKVPDIPFVWRAMEWAKRDGVIAFALHARFLFKRSDTGSKARDALFSSLRVTGVLNGIDLDDSRIWPGIKQPFCLLFGKNRVSSDSDMFYMVSPIHEKRLADAGRFRIDYASAQPIQIAVLRKSPDLVKALSIGTSLDADVMRRVRSLLAPLPDTSNVDAITQDENGNDVLPVSAPKAIRFGEYWVKSRHLDSGQGFKVSEDQKQNDASFLIKMGAAYLSPKDKSVRFHVEAGVLPKFKDLDRETLHTPRRKEIYQTPLVLISESPGAGQNSIRARIAMGETPIAFTESFYGYTSHDHHDGIGIAKYLFVVANSDLFVYYLLMTSAKFGVERRAIYEEDIADFPIIPYENISKEQKKEITELVNTLRKSNPDERDWEKLNKWVYRLYSLDSTDQQVIKDTLSVRMPYGSARRFANSIPGKAQIKRFADKLESLLRPFFDVECQIKNSSSRSWVFIDVVDQNLASTHDRHLIDTKFLESLADNEGVTRIVLEIKRGHIRIGLIAQTIFLTESRARLCALEIIRNHEASMPRRADG